MEHNIQYYNKMNKNRTFYYYLFSTIQSNHHYCVFKSKIGIFTINFTIEKNIYQASRTINGDVKVI